MFPIEGNRWLLTLTGGGGDFPPTDEDGSLAFADSLRSPLLADAIASARAGLADLRLPPYGEPLAALREAAMPGRLLAIGDSLCAFNPVYGQGMTVAAKEVAVLVGDCASVPGPTESSTRCARPIATWQDAWTDRGPCPPGPTSASRMRGRAASEFSTGS